jgi:DMSO/TMAO reductase YedYZ molybdopterin-dependent catalytic subunit
MRDLGLSRRGFLGAVGASLALGACKSNEPKGGALGAMMRWNDGVQGALLSGKEARRPGDGKVTVEGEFPSYHIAPDVPIVPDGWRLKVGGLVARPRSLTLDDLMHLPRTDIRVEHHCVEGWSAVADWHGVRISDLAELVGADPRAGFVDFRSFDATVEGTRYSSSWDRESAFHRQSLLAYGMNGRPLSPAYGAPVRLYGAVKLGYKNVKYLNEVNFLDQMTGGYWEDLGYEWYAGT